MEKKAKIIVAHPGKQHSYRLAIALERAGYLSQYITTVYNSNDSHIMRIVKHLISKENRIRANSRYTNMIPAHKIRQFCELQGLLTLALIRVDKSRCVYNWYNGHVSRVFGKKVAAYAIKNKVDIVICYDSAAHYCFKILKEKAPEIIRVIDNAAMNRYGLGQIYQELDKKYGILNDSKGYKSYLLNEHEAIQYKDEALLAHYHITASSFSKYTLTRVGIPDDKIAVIPYGVDTSLIPRKNKYSKEGKLKILYVGELSPQKGIYNLLEIVACFRDTVEIHIVGGGFEKLSNDTQKRIKQETIYHGYLLQEDLFKMYSRCDVFVFPTLGDGFGFVVVEAMAAGLPIICSGNSIGGDAIRDGFNGFVYQAGDTNQLKNYISYFVTHRSEVEIMGKNAINSTRLFSWDKYDSKVKSFFDRMVEQ